MKTTHSKKGEKKQSFSDMMLGFGRTYDLHALFDDFLTIMLSCLARNYETGESFDEALFNKTTDKYKGHLNKLNFSHLFATVIYEMEDKLHSCGGNDVLGEFYEVHLAKKGLSQFFTPQHLCDMMARCMIPEKETGKSQEPQTILDPSCGSGRTLLAAARVGGGHNIFYGIDIDHMCVKMAALNLFLNGIHCGEVMCADALNPSDFRMSYRLSSVPFGVYRIENKEESRLWNNLQAILKSGQPPALSVQQELPF